MLDRLQVLEQSAFFADVEAEHRLALAGLAREERVPAGSHLFREGDPADAFLVLAAGQVDLSLPIISAGADQPGQAPAAPPAPAGGGGRAGVTLRTVAAPGAPVGWSAVVEPYRHGVTAIARTDTTLLAWDREALHSYARRHPQFGLLFMRQVLTLAGDRLRAARLRLVASRYDAEVLAIQALLDQHGEQLPVTSPLHKIPHYLQNRLTFGDALAVVELLQSSDDRGERELADLVAETLEGVRRELRIYQRLQSIYELVAGAKDDVDPVALREQSCRRFVELFDDLPHVVAGQEHLPAQTGSIIVMNHLSNHAANALPNRFVLTLDTHFVSSMLLYQHYGQAPVRVIRAAGPREYGHRRYYDRLGYIYVSSRVPGEESARRMDPASFQEQAAAALAAGVNLVICPEGTSVPTERSPLRFRPGAFRLAAGLSPEPQIVPVAVANFDAPLARSTAAAVVHPPFRVSDVVADPSDPAQLLDFLNDSLHPQYVEWVRDAAARAEQG
jgi:CRP-like cAMP-binding protein